MTLVQNHPTEVLTPSVLHQHLFEVENSETPVDRWTPTVTAEEIWAYGRDRDLVLTESYYLSPRMFDAELNVELLDEVVSWARKEFDKTDASSEWDQATWIWPTYDVETEEEIASCGTTYCIAGRVGMLLDDRYAHAETVEGVHVSTFAGLNLGLSPAQASMLFHGYNTITSVEAVARTIKKTAIEGKAS